MSNSLWDRFQQFYASDDELGVSLDVSRMRFDDALREVARQTVFTTHTPVPAGHERFHGGLVEEHLGPLRDQLGISYEQLMGLGRVEPQNDQEPFTMTVVGLKISRRANILTCKSFGFHDFEIPAEALEEPNELQCQQKIEGAILAAR